MPGYGTSLRCQCWAWVNFELFDDLIGAEQQ